MNDPEQKLEHQRHALHALTDATHRLANAQRNVVTAADDRDTAIRNAMDSGLTYADIGAITGLSSARLSQIKSPNRKDAR